jgi:hypothetical protein
MQVVSLLIFYCGFKGDIQTLYKKGFDYIIVIANWAPMYNNAEYKPVSAVVSTIVFMFCEISAFIVFTLNAFVCCVG